MLEQGVDSITSRFHGDQNFLSKTLNQNQIRYFALDRIKSWRWQCLDGGFNFITRQYVTPGTGTHAEYPISLIIFHGNPKPSAITDPTITQYWQ